MTRAPETTIFLIHMDRFKAKRTMFYKAVSVVLVLGLCVAQVSLGLADTGAVCAPGADSSSVQPAPHACCGGEADPCCCDVRQESAPVLPDMALTPVSRATYDLTAQQFVLDGGMQSMLPPQVLKTTERWTGNGPPLILSYLVNLTFRC